MTNNDNEEWSVDGPWPDIDVVDEPDRSKSVFAKKLDSFARAKEAQQARANEEAKAESDAANARQLAMRATHDAWATANRATDASNLGKFYDNLAGLAVDGVARSRAAADTVQKASAAIAALYTGVLGVAFSVTANPLPARGVLAPIFLGLAVVLSTAYVAYLGPQSGWTLGPRPVLGPEPKVIQRLNAVIHFSNSIVRRRSYSLRASIVALGVGLACIVLPFVTFPSDTSKISSQDSWPQISSQDSWPEKGELPDLDNDELERIVFQAQVDLAKERISQSEPNDPHNEQTFTLIVFFVGLGLVLFLPFVINFAMEEKDQGNRTEQNRNQPTSHA